MADAIRTEAFPGMDPQSLETGDATLPRHSLPARITHWIHAASFLALIVSGIAILLAHPRLYWGETGNLNTPSLVDLPLPMLLVGQNGWGRYLHFLSAWIAVLMGLIYVLTGIVQRHFATSMLPRANDLRLRALAELIKHRKLTSSQEPGEYNALQRVTYSTVVFVLFPLVVWTGLAMSPAIISVFPRIVTILGGHQSARTIHFVISCSLVLFFLSHLAMVILSGFTRHVGAMITGKARNSEVEGG